MIVIGDVHGCYNTLIKLLKKCPDRKICFTGDLIDRGPKSRKVIDFIIKGNHYSVRGNHEEMMIDYAIKKIKGKNWAINGGIETLKNYENEPSAFNNHIKWMEKLPYYLDFPKTKNFNNRVLTVTHAGIQNLNFKEIRFREELLWNRQIPPLDIDGVYNIFGHTPQKDALIGNYYAAIDTGAYENKKLTAILYPELEIIDQEYSE